MLTPMIAKPDVVASGRGRSANRTGDDGRDTAPAAGDTSVAAFRNDARQTGPFS